MPSNQQTTPTLPAMTTEPSHGWFYFNPDTGTEWAEQHPVESGEVPDAENVRPATLSAVRGEMFDAWEALEAQRCANDEAVAALLAQNAAEIVAAKKDEREACAAECDKWAALAQPSIDVPFAPKESRMLWYGRHQYAEECAKSIRARGATETHHG
jgi:hypothetical protein